MNFKEMFNKTSKTIITKNVTNNNNTLKENVLLTDTELNENEYENVLLKNNIKIKSKFETKFGTEFKLAKKYDEDDIKKILKNYKVSFDDDSIFVSK